MTKQDEEEKANNFWRWKKKKKETVQKERVEMNGLGKWEVGMENDELLL